MFLLVSNSSIQKQILSNYFLKNEISENQYLSIDEFNYKVFRGDLNTNLYLIQRTNQTNDTILHFPDLDLKIGLFNLLFSRELALSGIHIEDARLHILNQDTTNPIQKLFSSLSSLNKTLSLSNLRFTNIGLINRQNSSILVDSLQLEIDNISISNNLMEISNLSIVRDSSLFLIDCHAANQQLSVTISDSYVHSQSPLLNLVPIDRGIYNHSLDITGDVEVDEHSIISDFYIKSGNSFVDFNFFFNKDSIIVNTPFSILKTQDFNHFSNRYIDIDSLNFSANLVFSKQDSLSLYNGYIDSNYGVIDFFTTIHQDSVDYMFLDLKNVNLSCVRNDSSLGIINSIVEMNDLKSQSPSLTASIKNIIFNNDRYNNISIDLSSLFSSDIDDNKVDLFLLEFAIDDKYINAETHVSLKKKSQDSLKLPFFTASCEGVVNKIDLVNLGYAVNDSLDFVFGNFKIQPFDLSLFEDIRRKNLMQPPTVEFNEIGYSKNNVISLIDFANISFSSSSSNEHNFRKGGINQKFYRKQEININSSIGSLNARIKSRPHPFQADRHLPIGISCYVDLDQASIVSDVLFNNIQFNDQLKLLVNNYDSESHLYTSQYSISCSTPDFRISNLHFLDVELSTDSLSNVMLEVDSLILANDAILEDISFQAMIDNSAIGSQNLFKDVGSFVLKYDSSMKNIKEGALFGDFEIEYNDYPMNFKNNSINMSFSDSSFLHFSNQFWKLDSLSHLVLNKDNLEFKNFSIYLDRQRVIVDGNVNQASEISFVFQDFRLKHLNPFLPNQNMIIDGRLDGSVFLNQSGFPMLSGDFEVDEFALNNVVLGKMQLYNSSNNQNDSIYTTGSIVDMEEIMSFVLKYPLDGTKHINSEIVISQFPGEVLDLMIKPISNLHGYGSGKIDLSGPIDQYDVFGEIFVDDIGFQIPYLKTTYFNNQDSLKLIFNNDSISVNEFTFFDSIHNTNALFNASIQHSALKNMKYELFIESDSLFALNTTKKDNEHYYGQVFLAGDMLVKGGVDKVHLDINGISKKGSQLMIPLSKSKEISENQFIQFTDNLQYEKIIDLADQKSSFNMNFNLEVNDNAEIQLIFDEEVGDLIKGYGQGGLYLKIDDKGEFQVFGDFQIENGNYLFTMQDVITKSFNIENGGLIKFSGNPYSALIDLNLLYNVQASLNPLNPDYDRKVKSPVICRMEMTEDLLNPDIGFFIDIPNADPIVETSLETITNTDQKLLEQFLYLLIANSFLVENDPTIDYLGNTLATTGTELLSNQLSNWLSQTTDVFDLGFKWIPGTGDSLSYQQIELAVSKKFLDDRVIVNGNVGTPPDQSEANIVGDVDIEYNFFRDGRLKLRVFNRAKDYDPFSESLGYEQGFGIFFKRSFNNFKDLFKSKRQRRKR